MQTKAVMCFSTHLHLPLAIAEATPLQVGSLLAATALTAALSLGAVDAAKADIAGLTPCSESKAFNKRQKNEIKNLNKRMKQVSIIPF